MRAPAASAVLAALLAAGCGSAGDGPVRAAVPPDCETVAPTAGHALPRDLPRPRGTVLASEARTAGEQAIVQGFVARTPSAARADLTQRAGLRVLFSEDDGADAEVTVTDGRHRTAYKLVRACPSGSRFTAVMVPEPR